MSNLRAPKSPDSLKDKALSNTIRQKLEMPEHVLVANFGDWSSASFIDDYFLIERAPLLTGHSLYDASVDFMKKIAASNDCPKGERTFTGKFLTYFDQATVKRGFLTLYRTAERKNKVEESRIERDNEVEIASNELVGEKLREEREKRRFVDITNQPDSQPLKVQVKAKSFSIQSPNTATSPNVPLIENENINHLSIRVDICLGTNTTYASPELFKEYKDIKEKHRLRHYLDSIEGAHDLFDQCISIEKNRFVDKVSQLNYHDSDFNRFIKFSMIDFGVNMLRISPMPINDERTMFVEVVVQLWKYFGNLTGLLSFKWCEKKDKDATTAIFFAKQEKNETYLLDGIGSNNKDTSNIVIESSGLNIATNIDHTLEDSVKNIKSATDALVNIMCKYPNASVSTLKKVHVYSIHTIQNTMTVIQYSWKDVHRWRAFECGSSLLPMVYEERKGLIQIYEILAFIYNDLLEQKKVIERLEDEHMGYIDVDENDLICNKSK